MVTNPSKTKGDRFELDIAAYLRTHGFPHAERALGAGRTDDRGDIHGIPGIVLECKNHQRIQLGPWVVEAEQEATNQRARHPVNSLDPDANALGFVVIKRHGIRHPAAAIVACTLATWCEAIR